MDTTGLIAVGVAGLVISLGAFNAYKILRKSEKGRNINRTTGKHENPREGGTRRKKHT